MTDITFTDNERAVFKAVLDITLQGYAESKRKRAAYLANLTRRTQPSKMEG